MLRPAQKSRKKLITGIFLILTVVVLIAVGFYFMKPKDSIPKNIKKSVNFTLYYPEKVPDGYSLNKGSIKIDNNILFFTLNNGGAKITVSEQSNPGKRFDFSQTPGFGEVSASAGEAVVGQISSQYVGILIADKTLVNIYTSNNVSRDVIVKIVQSMNKDD